MLLWQSHRNFKLNDVPGWLERSIVEVRLGRNAAVPAGSVGYVGPGRSGPVELEPGRRGSTGSRGLEQRGLGQVGRGQMGPNCARWR